MSDYQQFIELGSKDLDELLNTSGWELMIEYLSRQKGDSEPFGDMSEVDKDTQHIKNKIDCQFLIYIFIVYKN